MDTNPEQQNQQQLKEQNLPYPDSKRNKSTDTQMLPSGMIGLAIAIVGLIFFAPAVIVSLIIGLVNASKYKNSRLPLPGLIIANIAISGLGLFFWIIFILAFAGAGQVEFSLN
jgi:hypothetical protein